MLSSLLGLVAAALVALALCAYSAYSSAGGVRRGLAGGLDITSSVSSTAVRRNATVTRPTTRTTWRTPGHHAGITLGRVRWLGVAKRGIWAGFRDIVLILAGPGAGKTDMLACAVQDAAGALYAASSRSDLFEKTVNSRRKRPIYVFNPEDLGDTSRDPDVRLVRWSPVLGCRDPWYADLVAGYLVSGASTERKDAPYWEFHAHRVLRYLLAAADLAGETVGQVVEWSAGLAPELTRPVTILSREGAPAGWAADLHAALQSDPRFLDSISNTIATALKFWSLPQLREVATPDPAEQFDVHEYLRTGAALYVIGKERERDPVGPLFTAFTGVVFELAIAHAERSPGKRLDPPLTAVLDEATNIFRAPLDKWTSYFSGSGIPMLIGAQSRHQLRKAFGDDAADVIWNNATVHAAFGGNMDVETLERLSTLCGDRACEIGSTARRPILTPRDIKQLSDGTTGRPREILILRRAIPPVIAHAPIVWKRRRPPVAAPLVDDAFTPSSTGAEIVPFPDRRAA